MSPGDPTTPLPCDGMIEETQGLRARLQEDNVAVLGMLDRHLAALAVCRSHCWLRASTVGEETGK